MLHITPKDKEYIKDVTLENEKLQVLDENVIEVSV